MPDNENENKEPAEKQTPPAATEKKPEEKPAQPVKPKPQVSPMTRAVNDGNPTATPPPAPAGKTAKTATAAGTGGDPSAAPGNKLLGGVIMMAAGAVLIACGVRRFL